MKELPMKENNILRKKFHFDKEDYNRSVYHEPG